MLNEMKSSLAGDENPTLTSQNPIESTQDINQTQTPENKLIKPKRRIPFLKIFIFGFVIIITILAFSLIAYLILGNQTKQNVITTYEECVAAGFPIMESYPEQCAANGQTFTHELTEEEQKKLDSTPTSIPELTPFPTISASEAASWKTYIDKDQKISFKYPSEWTAKALEDWSFLVFLDSKPFEIPSQSELITPIQVSFNEVLDTTTNKKYFREKTIDEAQKNISELFEPNTIQIKNITVGGKKAVQLKGQGTGMLGGDLQYTLVQMDNKILLISLLNHSEFENIYQEILSTFKFTD